MFFGFRTNSRTKLFCAGSCLCTDCSFVAFFCYFQILESVICCSMSNHAMINVNMCYMLFRTHQTLKSMLEWIQWDSASQLHLLYAACYMLFRTLHLKALLQQSKLKYHVSRLQSLCQCLCLSCQIATQILVPSHTVSKLPSTFPVTS